MRVVTLERQIRTAVFSQAPSTSPIPSPVSEPQRLEVKTPNGAPPVDLLVPKGGSYFGLKKENRPPAPTNHATAGPPTLASPRTSAGPPEPTMPCAPNVPPTPTIRRAPSVPPNPTIPRAPSVPPAATSSRVPAAPPTTISSLAPIGAGKQDFCRRCRVTRLMADRKSVV